MSNVAGRDVVGRATWRSYVAEIPAWAIVLGAMAVSFWTQVDAVKQHAMAWWEALIWGSSTDFGTLACLFLAREGAHRGTPTWGAWVLSGACAFMSVQFNVVDGIQHHDWLEVEAHVWMPALALGVWYWTLHGRHRRWTRAATGSSGPAAETERAPVAGSSGGGAHDERALPAPSSSAPRVRHLRAPDAKRAPAGERKRQMRELLAAPEGRELTSEQIGDRLGINAGYARRLRAELEGADPELGRRPRVVQVEAAAPAAVAEEVSG